MTDCRRNNKFGKYEKHLCFVCNSYFYPGQSETCPKCNWKKCLNGHCGCSVSKETRNALDNFYDLFCKPSNYSSETKNALLTMLRTYNIYCRGSLK